MAEAELVHAVVVVTFLSPTIVGLAVGVVGTSFINFEQEVLRRLRLLAASVDTVLVTETIVSCITASVALHSAIITEVVVARQ